MLMLIVLYVRSDQYVYLSLEPSHPINHYIILLVSIFEFLFNINHSRTSPVKSFLTTTPCRASGEDAGR